MVRCLLLFVSCSVCFAQQYEVGADIGYGVYHDGTIFTGTVTAEAGVRNRFAAGIQLGDELTKYISAEFHYLYQDGHPFLDVAGTRVDIQGQSHALTADLLFHFKPREHRWRPFLDGGAGAKDYVIAGPAPYPQPFPQVASLITNDVWKVAFSAGGGIKFRLIPHMLLRAEFRDYITTFARQQIVPAPHNTARGIFEQFTPLFGISYTR
jgi:opacity protein-like surface antigen